MTKILVVGCSMTKGHGLRLERDDPALWVNQLVNSNFVGAEILNLAEAGKNNHWIFTEATSALIKNDYDVAIIGWSNIDRLNFNVGLELYSTETMFRNMDININPGVTVTGKTLEKLGDQLQKLKNSHWNILDLIKYINILHYIQVRVKKSKLFFVNTLTSYPLGYFQRLTNKLPSELDSYTQQLLGVDTRDDDEINKLYNMMHDQYHCYGGIHEDLWLNLNTALIDIAIDTVSDIDEHPGYKSQDIFTNYLTPILKEKL